MGQISESRAWEILKAYARDCIQIDFESLLAIYAIGSLPGGYYRPGQSDIDAVLITTNGSEKIWGDVHEASQTLKDLNERYLRAYEIPKDFGPFPIQEGELFPPYNPAKELAAEIARLKLQGKPVYGDFNLQSVPMPTPGDFLRDAQHFEEWWRDEFSKTNPLETLSATGCVNTILAHLRRYLRIKRGKIVFDKHKVVPEYLCNDPPIADEQMFRLVEQFLRLGEASDRDTRELRRYVGVLRDAMNSHLGIST